MESPPTIPISEMSPELKKALADFQAKPPKISLHDLFRVQKKNIILARRLKQNIPDIIITLPPLQLSKLQENDEGTLIIPDQSMTRPDAPVRPDKIPTNIVEAEKKFKAGEITEQEFAEAIHTHGSNTKSGIAFWSLATDPHPGMKGNNKSRRGFMHDVYHTAKGKLFQGVVKGAILAAINMAHEDWLNKYDKDAFVYDDPMLIELDMFLKTYIDEHMSTEADRQYHFDRILPVIDLFLGLQKEDILYRTLFKDVVNTFCGYARFPMTVSEQEHFDQWCHKD
jgi:hypothetical protein